MIKVNKTQKTILCCCGKFNNQELHPGDMALTMDNIIERMENRKFRLSYNYLCAQLRWLALYGLVERRRINQGKKRAGNKLKGYPSYYRLTSKGVEAVREWVIDNTERLRGTVDRDSDLRKYIGNQLK